LSHNQITNENRFYHIAIKPPTLPILSTPVRLPAAAASAPAPASDPAALTDLQAQLHDTQSSLAQHGDKVRVLEDAVVKEQEAIKKEVEGFRGLIGVPGPGLGKGMMMIRGACILSFRMSWRVLRRRMRSRLRRWSWSTVSIRCSLTRT